MTVLQAENLEGIRDHEALLLVIRGRDSLKALEALQGSISSLRLVRHHSVRVRESLISPSPLCNAGIL